MPAHLPDRPSPPRIFSQTRRIARARRHARLCARAQSAKAQSAGDGPHSLETQQFLHAEIARDIADRLDFMRFAPAPTLIHGNGAGLLGAELAARGFAVCQTSPASLAEEQPLALPDGAPAPALIVHLATLDTVNDLPGALLHIRRALPSGGLFIASFPGNGSMPMLRAILQAADGDRPAARMHPQIDIAAASALMQRAGFARQVVDSHRLEVRYRSFDRMVADLRVQGLHSVLADAPPPFTRAGLARARAAFAALADEHGSLGESFVLLTLTGWG